MFRSGSVGEQTLYTAIEQRENTNNTQEKNSTEEKENIMKTMYLC